MKKYIDNTPMDSILKDRKEMIESCQSTIKFVCEQIAFDLDPVERIDVIGGSIEMSSNNVRDIFLDICQNLTTLNCIDNGYIDKPIRQSHSGMRYKYYSVICHPNSTYQKFLKYNGGKVISENPSNPDLCIIINPNYRKDIRKWIRDFRKIIDTKIPCIIIGHFMDCSFIEIEDILVALQAFPLFKTCLNPHKLRVKNFHCTAFQGRLDKSHQDPNGHNSNSNSNSAKHCHYCQSRSKTKEGESSQCSDNQHKSSCHNQRMSSRVLELYLKNRGFDLL